MSDKTTCQCGKCDSKEIDATFKAGELREIMDKGLYFVATGCTPAPGDIVSKKTDTYSLYRFE